MASSSTHDLAALLGGGTAAAVALQGQSRVVSASSSVVSANSLSSSSTKLSSTGGGGGVEGPHATKNFLMDQAMGASSALPGDSGDSSTENKKCNSSDTPKALSTSSALSSALEGDGGLSSGNPTMVMHMGAPPHPVAEFLFQLTKMLTDNNTQYIEWRNASIFVHDPPGLEKDILPKYFRHSNYSSFQRQMNYFGFRKIAGKGKMAPCSYVNEAAKEDISSLLFIKRKKTSVSSAAAKLMAQQNRLHRSLGAAHSGAADIGSANPLVVSSMMGAAGALGPGAAALGGGSLSLNNFSMIGGLPGVGTGATAEGLMTAATNSTALNETSLLREQQDVLAQLQQAHASALSNNPVPATGSIGGMTGINPAQTKLDMGGLSIGNGGVNTSLLGNDQGNLGLLTNDQGNIYTNANNAGDWGSPTEASVLIQQATSGLTGGNFPQGASSSGADNTNNFARIDSAANLRALLNQQISMFNTPAPGDTLSPSLSALAGGSVAMPAAQALGPSSQQAMSGPSSLSTAGNVGQWNEMLQRMGCGGGGSVTGGSTTSIRQFEQQLLQGGGNTPGPATSSQSFNLNGVFGSAVAGGAQGFPC